MYADHQPQAVDETRKHERFRDFPDTEEVTGSNPVRPTTPEAMTTEPESWPFATE